jgi:hypothetical protein
MAVVELVAERWRDEWTPGPEGECSGIRRGEQWREEDRKAVVGWAWERIWWVRSLRRPVLQARAGRGGGEEQSEPDWICSTTSRGF